MIDSLDWAEKWLEEHPDEVRTHAGKSIALHPKLGIVASSKLLTDVVQEVKRKGYLNFELILYGK